MMLYRMLALLLLFCPAIIAALSIDGANMVDVQVKDPISDKDAVPKLYMETEIVSSLQFVLDFLDCSATASTSFDTTTVHIANIPSDLTVFVQQSINGASFASIGSARVGPGDIVIPSVCGSVVIKVCTGVLGSHVCRPSVEVNKQYALESAGPTAHAAKIDSIMWPSEETYTIQARIWAPSTTLGFHFMATHLVSTPTTFQSIFRHFDTYLNIYQRGNYCGNIAATLPFDQWAEMTIVATSGTYTYYLNGVDVCLGQLMSDERERFKGSVTCPTLVPTSAPSIVSVGDHISGADYAGNYLYAGSKIEMLRMYNVAFSSEQVLANPPHTGASVEPALAAELIFASDFTEANALDEYQNISSSFKLKCST